VLRVDLLRPDDLPVRFGRFELLGLLGEGGFGRVFRARYEGGLGLQKDVALKVLRGRVAAADAGVVDSVRQEARLGAALRHPNLVDVLDAGEVDGSPWLAMELIEGGSLAERIKQGGVAPPEALELARGIGTGLSWMHRFRLEDSVGVVHRDLKPANVLLHHGVPRIADYGLATAFVSGDGAAAWTRAVGGTPAYMSPEQSRGEPLDGRSDLFALGAITFELLTGTRYLPGRTLIELVMNLVRIEEFLPRLRVLDEVAPGLTEAVTGCLRSRREDRWPDVDSFLDALSQLDPRAEFIPSSPTVVGPGPSMDTLRTPASDTGWFVRLGTDAARAQLKRRGGEAKLQRLIDDLPALRGALEQARGEDAGWIALAMAAPLMRLKRWRELEAAVARPVESEALKRRLRWLTAACRRRQGHDVEADLVALFDGSVVEDPTLAAEVAVELTHVHLGRNLESARAWAERALLLFSESGDRVRAAKSLSEIAMVDRMQGFVTRAVERFDEARGLLEAEADERDVLNVLVNVWPVLADVGRRHEAHEVAARAMELADEIGDHDVCLHAGSNRAAMLAQSGYLRRAIHAGEDALGRWGDGNPKLVIWLTASTAYWRGLLGDAGAEAVVQSCVEQFEQLESPRLAGLLAMKRLELGRRLRGDRGLEELDRITAVFAGSDPRGEAEAALERAWRTRTIDDAHAAMEAARRQSVFLACEALVLLATVQAGVESNQETLRTGLRLAMRTEHLLHAARLELVAGRGADPDGVAIHRARAEGLLADLGVPLDAPALL
jgi:tetratricopeptide (TPR) repeat protein